MVPRKEVSSQDAALVVRASPPLALPGKRQLQWVVVRAPLCTLYLLAHLPCKK